MGIRTPISHNFALPLGGLRQGVTPLDMAHAYETFATGGKRVWGSLSPPGRGKTVPAGPVGITSIENDDKAVKLPNGEKAINRKRTDPVLKAGIAQQVGSILQTVVQSGSGTRAQIPGVVVAGKTGTTENYGDAWFVGWTKEYTVAVWVGYPDKFKPMKTEFQGEPVAGGTYPAEIWRTFMTALLKIDKLPGSEKSDAEKEGGVTPVAPPTEGAAPSVTAAPTAAPGTGGTGGAGTQQTPPATQGGGTTPPATEGGGTTPPAPTPSPAATPPPAATQPPSGAGGAGATAPAAGTG